MINVSRVVNSPRLAQIFQIIRSTGSFVNGIFQQTTQTIQGYGVISVAQSRDLEMIPEGDKIVGAMVFHCEQPIYGTHGDAAGNGGVSDILIWRGEQFRVLRDAQYVDYGYFRAIATRLKAS